MGSTEKEETILSLQNHMDSLLKLTLLFKIEEFEILENDVIWEGIPPASCKKHKQNLQKELYNDGQPVGKEENVSEIKDNL